MNSTSDSVDPYFNLPKGLNDENLWKAMIKRIDEIDDSRRSIRNQIQQSTQKKQSSENPIDYQWIDTIRKQSDDLSRERAALHDEMGKIKNRIKSKRRERNGRPVESLAIEFMLIAQKKLGAEVFNAIRDEAAMNVALYKP